MNRPVSSSHARSGASKVLFIVEDNKALRDMLAALLRIQGEYAVVFATCGSEALERLRTFRPDLLLLDYRLPDMTGLQLYDHLHAQADAPLPPAILMSATCPFSSDEERRRWMFLQKPFHFAHLCELLTQALTVSCE